MSENTSQSMPHFSRKLFAIFAALSVSLSHASSDIAMFDPYMAIGEVTVTNGMKWIDGNRLPIEGRAFDDVESWYDRLPAGVTTNVNEGVRRLKHHTAGMQFRFSTDSRKLVFRWKLLNPGFSMDHMPDTGINGIDVYRFDERKSRWRYVKTGRVAKTGRGELEIPWMPGTPCLVNLPLCNGIESFALGVDENADVRPLGPRKSGIDKPVVFYGTSITHGGCASRPGMSFVNIVGRELDVPVVNLGFSGSGRMEMEMVDHLSRIDASCYVLDCLWNMARPSPDAGSAFHDMYAVGFDAKDPISVVRFRYEPFVRALRAKRPDVPIVMAEQCDVYCKEKSEKNKFVRALYEKLVAEGWRNLVYLPNDGMYPDDVEGTVDGVHPNDWGMMHMAKAYGGAVGKALFGATAPGERSESFRIRDPFVFADVKTRTYYLYGVEHYIGETNETTGVWVRKSKDLETWSEARRVMVARRGTQCVWAPEVHEYKGAYYMFATLKDYPDKDNPLVMMGPTPEWSSNVCGLWNSWHATWIYRAESPEGPFLPVSERPVTPPGWVALDGTLYVEDGRPYLVFTHDWLQVADGTIEIAPLADDLSELAGPPKTIFRASAIAPGTLKGITDGPFVHRSPQSGRLFITWSTQNPDKQRAGQAGYCVVSSESATGLLEGPWVNHHIIFDSNGGHGMVFRTFDGRLKFALHSPDVWGKERLALYDFVDNGKGICIVEKKETASFQKAIDAAHAAGGGRVTVPDGEHLVGALHLKSNVELHLEDKAVLVFSDDPADYLPAVQTSWEGVECFNLSPLVYACGATNISITGKGRLVARHGFWKGWNGAVRSPLAQKAWEKLVYDWGENDVPVGARRLSDEPGAAFRPHFIQFNRCRDVRLDGFSMRGSPFWTIHLFLCDGAEVRNLDVDAFDAEGFAMKNTDGIDIESSRNVLVEGCTFRQNDDGIVIKSGRNRDGRRIGVPAESVTIRDCVVKQGHGLLVVGSEMSGGVRNILMENCRVEGEAARLLYIKTARPRGGFIENVVMRDVTAAKVLREMLAVNSSYMIEPNAEARSGSLPVPRIAGIRMENVRCVEAKKLYAIEGDPECPIDGVVLEGVVADSVEAPSTAENVRNLAINGIRQKDPPTTPFKPPHW